MEKEEATAKTYQMFANSSLLIERQMPKIDGAHNS